MSEDPIITPEEFLSDTCDFCGRENWQHTERQSVHGDKDLLPCLEMFIDHIGQHVWDREADEDGNCKRCGKPLVNHIVFERISTKVMNKEIWDRSPVAFLYPKKELPCEVVSEEGPLIGRTPSKRVGT